MGASVAEVVSDGASGAVEVSAGLGVSVLGVSGFGVSEGASGAVESFDATTSSFTASFMLSFALDMGSSFSVGLGGTTVSRPAMGGSIPTWCGSLTQVSTSCRSAIVAFLPS